MRRQVIGHGYQKRLTLRRSNREAGGFYESHVHTMTAPLFKTVATGESILVRVDGRLNVAPPFDVTWLLGGAVLRYRLQLFLVGTDGLSIKFFEAATPWSSDDRPLLSPSSIEASYLLTAVQGVGYSLKLIGTSDSEMPMAVPRGPVDENVLGVDLSIDGVTLIRPPDQFIVV
jgi:hypothetical protein